MKSHCRLFYLIAVSIFLLTGCFCIANLILKDMLCHFIKGYAPRPDVDCLQGIVFLSTILSILSYFVFFCFVYEPVALVLLTSIFHCLTFSTEHGSCLLVYACSVVTVLAIFKGEGCLVCIFLGDFLYDAVLL